MKELVNIQTKLKVGKGKYNSFLHANFRSAEDILKEVKQLLADNECTLVLTDDIIAIGNDYRSHHEDSVKGVSDDYEGQRFYVKATATLTNSSGESVSATAFARESLEKQGVDVAQVTGSASSYARKYALNGLFALDDGSDPDIILTKGEKDELENTYQGVKKVLLSCKTVDELQKVSNDNQSLWNYQPYVELVNKLYNQLQK